MRQVLRLESTDETTWSTTVELESATSAILQVADVVPPYEVLVAGGVVARGDAQFARLAVPVRLPAGSTRIEARCGSMEDLLDAQPTRPRARWRTALAEHRLRWVRTTLMGRMPGLCTGPPRVGPQGPWVLDLGSPVRSLRLTPRFVDGVCSLDIEAQITGLDAVEVVVGDQSWSVPIVEGVVSTQVEVAAEPWWPHSHGTPHLYDVRLRADGRDLDLPGDGTTDLTRRRVGFRALGNGSPSGRPSVATASLDLWLNGVPVFVRGAVWTPGSLDALDRAVELGLNLVRVPGIATYESDAFHERCAELGLLVWQDLMFATFDYPLADERFVVRIAAEVDGELDRIGALPSTVVVCGSSEHEQQAAMLGLPECGAAARELATLLGGLVTASGIDAIWVPSTPTGGVLPFRPDAGVAHYFGVGAYRRPLLDARTAGVRFASECLAFAHPSDPLVAGGVPQDNGADWDFADITAHYVVEHALTSGEVTARTFAEWRRADSTCHGAIVLWLRDLEPGAGWGLLDVDARPKPAALVAAPIWQSRAVWFVDEGTGGLRVHVANDPAEPLSGELVVELLRVDDTVAESASVPLEVGAHEQVEIDVEAVLGRFVDASYAYRFGPPQFAAVTARVRSNSGDLGPVRWLPSAP